MAWMDNDGKTESAPARKDRSHWLYIAAVVAEALGILVGLLNKELAIALKPLGTGFVALIKMMISPVTFCTIVLGIGSVRQAAKVGRVGGPALGYFLIMSTFALAIGLVVGNLVKPGEGLDITPGEVPAGEEAAGTVDVLLGIIPTTLVSPLVGDSVLSTLFVALLVGFAIQPLGRTGEAALREIAVFQRLGSHCHRVVEHRSHVEAGAAGQPVRVDGARRGLRGAAVRARASGRRSWNRRGAWVSGRPG